MNKAKILIVEDEIIVAKNIEKRLLSSGYSVSGIAASSEQALNKVEIEKPDLVLMDIKLDGEEDGIGTADLLRKKYQLPVIFLTSYTDDETFQRAKVTEPFGYIIKPFDIKELNRTIEMALYKNNIDKKLHENQQRFEIAVKAGKTFIWELWLDNYKLITDKNFRSFFGKDFLSFDDWLTSFPEPDKNNFLMLISLCRDKKNTDLFFEHKLMLQNGREYWVTENAVLILPEEDKPLRLIGATKDITDRKNSEMELLKSEKRFRSIFENSGAGMAILPPGKNFSKVNKAFCNMLGYTEDEFLKMGFRDITHPEDIQKSLELKESLDNNEIIESASIEKRYLHKSGKSVWTSTTVSLVKDSAKNPAYYVIQCQDITKRKIAEEELASYTDQLKSLNVSKDKFFSIISHDLRSPFNALLGITEYMIHSLKEMTDEEIFDSINNVHKSAQKLYDLILNLLEWSRIQSGRLEAEKRKIRFIDICNELSTLYKELSSSKNVLFQHDVSEDIIINADKYMIETVMRNLVTNAIKFTKPGGKVSVTVSAKNKFAVVSVEDTGIGIDNENISKLFRIDVQYNRNGTANEKGTGLGLILCKEFVEANGGTISVESEPNSGSRFMFTVPLAES